MCQLFGVSANRPVNLEFSLREWRYRGRQNPHGHGFACWGRGGWTVKKEPSSLFRAPLQAMALVRSRIFLCHVRWATAGGIDGLNTHPFLGELEGRVFAFAHNGTVGTSTLPLRRRSPQGATDSEHAFLWMLENLEGLARDEFTGRLQALAEEVASRGRFNFLLSDGTTLWARAHDRLHFLERRPPYGEVPVALWEAGITMQLGAVKARDEHAVLVATEPLTDEGWTALRPGEMLVARGGRVVARLPA
ncbi:MAG TPA: class II glutamine amidotransferase [Candidatus Nitrosotenuis sp.]|nr:class II glutamine amidotransferase [Candidatus Nitrosotenuis sp.]